MTTVGTWLARQRHLDRLDREVLLNRATGLSRAQMLTRPEIELSPAVAACLDGWAERRSLGEPVAYIVGVKEFWGAELAVSRDVLVPRPETELLVEGVVEAVAGWKKTRGESRSGDRSHGDPLGVLELGTGSGAVAIAVSREYGESVTVIATDISPAALAVAQGNAERLGAIVSFIESDWFGAVAGRYHVIASNPPYVAANDPHLQALAYEPRLALASGPDGLDAIRRIAAGAGDHLLAGGALLLEHGYDQGAAVRHILERCAFRSVTTLKDLAGHERVTRGLWEGNHEP